MLELIVFRHSARRHSGMLMACATIQSLSLKRPLPTQQSWRRYQPLAELFLNNHKAGNAARRFNSFLAHAIRRSSTKAKQST
jgi:hypothetical protein